MSDAETAPGAHDRFHAFDDPVQDALLRLVLSLGAEVWVLKDRLILLEQALADQGIEVSEPIETLSQDPGRAPAMQAQRDAFMARFLGDVDFGAPE